MKKIYRIHYDAKEKEDLKAEEWIRNNIPHQEWSEFRREAIKEKVETIKNKKKGGLV